MPVKITILSGSRQGEIVETAEQVVAVGDRPDDDIVFDAASDSGIRQRRATLKLEGGSWKVHSGGSKPIFVNQDTVSGAQALRSGDIVRMSPDGPDFSFELVANISETVRSASSQAEGNRGPSVSGPPVQPEEDTGHDSAPLPVRSPDVRTFVLAALILVVLLSAWGLSAVLRTEGEPESSRPRFQPFGIVQAKEGETILWKPTIENGSLFGQSLRFKLIGDVPGEMTIDEATGTVKWRTREEHGPGEYRCDVMAYVDGAEQSLSSTARLEIQVKEVNRPPEPARLATQEVNLSVGNELKVALQATDADAPAQNMSYRLLPSAPDGISLDTGTGQLTWNVPESLANQVVDIPYQVIDDAAQPLSAEGIVRVRVISPDPWSIAESKLHDSIYLLAAKTNPGQAILPLGTAAAIADHTLLTSATVASGAANAARRGWTILAIDTRDFRLEDPKGIEVTEIRSHVGYVEATNQIQQAYFDLAVLTTEQSLPAICKLGDVETSVTNGQELGCFGYEIHDGSLSRFDKPRPEFAKATLWAVIPPANEAEIPGRTPYLLQLEGQLPHQPFGSLVVTQEASVVGVYAFRGELPDTSGKIAVHYAPDIMLASAFLAGGGEKLWVPPKDEPPSQPHSDKQ